MDGWKDKSRRRVLELQKKAKPKFRISNWTKKKEEKWAYHGVAAHWHVTEWIGISKSTSNRNIIWDRRLEGKEDSVRCKTNN
jgi:hypothetical protein